MSLAHLKHFHPRRPSIFLIVMGAMLLVGLVPIGLYHRRVLDLSQRKLEETEPVQQTEITRALAEQVQLFESSLYQQLISQRQILALTGLIDDVNDPAKAPKVARLLENFVKSSPNVMYLTAVGRNARGSGAGDFPAYQDPFVSNALQRGFTACVQSLRFQSDPLAIGPDNRPAIVMAIPLQVDDQFTGMLAAVVSLDSITRRLQETSGHDRMVYLVNRTGRIVAHPDTRNFVPGTDVSSTYQIAGQIKDLPRELRTTQTVHFTLTENGRPVEMFGTYSTIPELDWAVIAQRSLNKAREDAGVKELNAQALGFVAVITFIALVSGYIFAVAISRPVRSLAASTRAISRGEFHQRTPVQGPAEISELAETFNGMAEDIEQYVERLKQAAEQNRELFLGSIRMLAAAIDEKDPYTRGHSGRVAKYSVLIGKELSLSAEELDRLRISALLHDVGKIGVDDRVLKKPGALTAEEFDLMKQHTVKGANIMRPVAQLKEMLPGIELHHEHIDGRGYPYGLKGEAIPLMARIIAVADTLDAMTTDRPYQTAKELDTAVELIRRVAGSKFDPGIVDALEGAIRTGKLRLNLRAVEVPVEV